jgi:hypothetical protein
VVHEFNACILEVGCPTAWQPPASYQTDGPDPQHRCLQARKLIYYNHKNAEKLRHPDKGIEFDQA